MTFEQRRETTDLEEGQSRETSSEAPAGTQVRDDPGLDTTETEEVVRGGQLWVSFEGRAKRIC